MWSLPYYVEIDGAKYNIRNKCDYRVILDVICALNDNDLELRHRMTCALFIFYENLSGCSNIEAAMHEMFKIINCGEDVEKEANNKPTLMDWQHDFKLICPPISRVLGYEVRTPEKFTHWYSFIGAYMEIGGECSFSKVISIRAKQAKGKKLEKWELEFLRENRKMIDLPKKLTAEEEFFLNSEW